MFLTYEEYLAGVDLATNAAKSYYHTGSTIMSDDEYDNLVENIRAAGNIFGWTEGNNVVNMVAGGTEPKDTTITHAVPMISLDKLNSPVELKKFITLVGEKNLILEPKMDGSALSVVYKNGELHTAAGRGTGLYANDLTQKVRSSNVNGIPLKLNKAIDIEIRGELYITHADFEVAQAGRIAAGEKEFSNSRNAVSGAINNDKNTSYIHITFAAYECIGLNDNSYTKRMDTLRTLGFLPALDLMPKSLNEYDTLETKVEAFGKLRAGLSYLTDGIVLKCDDYAIRASMGEGSHGPRYNKAWKYNADEKRGITTILGIDYTIGKTGRLGMIARLKPVQLDTLVSNVSLHNVKWIENRDIRIGSTIEIFRANGVIPYISAVVSNPKTSTKWVAPAVCPQCGQPFDKSTQLWRCVSPECSILGAVLYAGSKDVLDWDGFSTAIATKLVESGRVSNVADVFTLTSVELANLYMGRLIKQGEKIVLGEKTATKIYNNIQTSKNKSLANVITSLSLRKMGRTMGKRVAAYFGDMATIQNATLADFMYVEGVAENKAAEYLKGFKNKKEIIERLRSYGVTMSVAKSVPTDTNNATNKPLTGKKVVVTGSMKGTALDGLSRTDMNELIEKNGGASSSSVSSSTNILVCGETGSSKYKKAKELGTVEILSPDSFAALIGR